MLSMTKRSQAGNCTHFLLEILEEGTNIQTLPSRTHNALKNPQFYTRRAQSYLLLRSTKIFPLETPRAQFAPLISGLSSWASKQTSMNMHSDWQYINQLTPLATEAMNCEQVKITKLRTSNIRSY